MKNYQAAVEEMFSILNAAWNSPSSGAKAVTEKITGTEWARGPQLLQPGNEYQPSTTEIYGKAAYQSVTETKISTEDASRLRRYKSTGMLGVQVRYPWNDAVTVRIARSLAQAVQDAFRSASSSWIDFSNERIIEVGQLKGAYQINIFVTCTFETEVQI